MYSQLFLADTENASKISDIEFAALASLSGRYLQADTGISVSDLNLNYYLTGIVGEGANPIMHCDFLPFRIHRISTYTGYSD